MNLHRAAVGAAGVSAAHTNSGSVDDDRFLSLAVRDGSNSTPSSLTPWSRSKECGSDAGDTASDDTVGDDMGGAELLRMLFPTTLTRLRVTFSGFSPSAVQSRFAEELHACIEKLRRMIPPHLLKQRSCQTHFAATHEISNTPTLAYKSTTQPGGIEQTLDTTPDTHTRPTKPRSSCTTQTEHTTHPNSKR